jgi:cell division protein FtsB
MFSRWRLTFVLLSLLVLTQAGLWIGKGGVSHAMSLRGELAEWEGRVAEQKRTNARLQAEVEDLRTGLELVEERARELGMVKPDEIYVQYAAPSTAPRRAPQP